MLVMLVMTMIMIVMAEDQVLTAATINLCNDDNDDEACVGHDDNDQRYLSKSDQFDYSVVQNSDQFSVC